MTGPVTQVAEGVFYPEMLDHTLIERIGSM
jgi:hypothetical protein